MVTDVDVTVTGDADDERGAAAIGVDEHDDDVLQGVRGGPRAAVGAGVLRLQDLDERLDRRRPGGVDDPGRARGDLDRRGLRDLDGLDVRRVVRAGRPGEGVLAALVHREELLARRATHGAGHRGDDDVLEAEALEEAAILLPQGANGPAILALPNHYVIRRYNNSVSYALAIGLTADGVSGKPGLVARWPDDPPISREQRIGALALAQAVVDGDPERAAQKARCFFDEMLADYGA